MRADLELFLPTRAAEGMSVDVWGELLEGSAGPHICVPCRAALPACPDALIPPAAIRASSQMVGESGNGRTDASQAICIRAAFLRADAELRVLQLVQP